MPLSIHPIPVIIAALRITKEALEERLPELIKRYGVLFAVADAQPYTITVEKIAQAHPQRMSICFFGGKKTYSCSTDFVQVTANRTNMLDEVTDSIPVGKMMVATGIPDYEMLWQHMKHLVKVKAEDDDGTEYYEYVKVGDDHYGYATGYACLAKKIWIEQKPMSEVNVGPVNITGATVSL